jgi:hypothetical protein
MPPMPEGAEQGILKGLYKFKPGVSGKKLKAQIFGSGPILRQALAAQEILAERYHVSADVWSATNYKQLRTDALACSRWNMLHPTEPARRSYVETVLEKEKGAFVAVSDFMKIVPEQIAQWVPGGLTVLGTDGFGRSDTRENLRRFFEIDANMTVIATLHALAKKARWTRPSWRKPSRISGFIRRKFTRFVCEACWHAVQSVDPTAKMLRQLARGFLLVMAWLSANPVTAADAALPDRSRALVSPVPKTASPPIEPVYRLKISDGKQRFLTRGEITVGKLESRVDGMSFLAVCTNDWLPGLVPIFAVEKTNRFELRRRPQRGHENSSEPLFFALPPEDEPNATCIAGRWQCDAVRGDNSKAFLAWELTLDGDRSRDGLTRTRSIDMRT